VFKASVENVVRTEDDKQWRLEMFIDSKSDDQVFDKVALCHGYQTIAEMPTYEGSETFEGTLMHSQQYR
jgi:dimethylaniline monooxygenase (N-oxide forming)